MRPDRDVAGRGGPGRAGPSVPGEGTRAGESAGPGEPAGAEAARTGRGTQSGPVGLGVGPAPARRREPGGARTPISRSRDRAITTGGLELAGTYLAAAVIATFLPADVRHGIWLPLHLALAGGATTAIAAALPFFTASLLAVAPAPAAARVLAVGLVATGAGAVAAGVAAGASGTGSSVAAAGGTAFVAGVVATAWVAFRPLSGSLGPRHALVVAAYAAALADVAVGATVATLYVGGYEPVLRAWALLKPAHAWLNLFGFVTLLIAGTLIHLYPTVLATRIPARRSVAAAAARLFVVSLAAGPPVVAAGFWLGVPLLARSGALVELAGAAALAAYAGAIWRARGRWTTDRAWHETAIGSLTAGIGWFAVAAGIAFVRTAQAGSDPSAWSIDTVAAPLVVGWVAQAILGAWTHIAPSIGPGDPRLHARQRRALGVAARPRLAAFQLGTLALTLGIPMGMGWLTAAGTVLAAAALLSGLGLLLALSVGRLPGFAVLNDAAERR